ncbi:hypothetical protein BGZ61DRAFT_526577 [Ilyonectria robusta]|uniref:uncharacterized protein n=1 Tax=Ilyonectria robusta TaxID=1079257 RepID=UPI001E8DB55F|nr:uncharacterized protein BGZ61DRAFT_526577 [Ilyonectria robusta]KAH8735504.1 hypothetical protein BGZ61DRAFT_526577 [Ilyonectria robusta]
MVLDIGEAIIIETRAYNNDGRVGFDLYESSFSYFSFQSPTINTFKDPRWGRDRECPSEDPFHAQNFVRAMLSGLEDDFTGYRRVIATCKHYAANDFGNYEGTERYGLDAIITTQELSEY